MIPQVYVYATDGYTETSIKDFLTKMNPRIKWIIRSPRLKKLPKKDYLEKELLPILTGKTGEALETFMLDEIGEHSRILTECAAVLLEDDLDMRDAEEDQNTFLSAQQERLQAKLSAISEAGTARMICLYAAPEVETWLIEDWENSFGNARRFSQQIATQLRKPINDRKGVCGDSFERYSHHFSKKLSDWLVEQIQRLSIEYGITDVDKAFYSKKHHGSEFLRAIDPSVIEKKCRIYFAKAYHAIQNI